MSIKWGFVGSGLVCHDFLLCIRSQPEGEHEVIAVADLNFQNAQNFASEHDVPVAYGSYEELAKNDECDIIYIGVINPLHYETCKFFLESDKNVLCEKPLVMDFLEAEELVNLARKRKRFFMEGLWIRFTPLYKKLKEELNEGVIGDVNLVEVSYCFIGTTRDRLVKRKLGGGCVLDNAVYGLSLVTFIFGGDKPEHISSTGILNEEGVEEVVTIALKYSRKRIANVTMSFRCHGYNAGFVAGSKGTIQILPPYQFPRGLETPTRRYEINPPKIKGAFNYPLSTGLVYELQDVRDCLKKGLLESPVMPLEDSKVVSYIMTEVRRQLGII